MDTNNTTTETTKITKQEIYTMTFTDLRAKAKEMSVYVGPRPSADSIRQKLIVALALGKGRKPKVPTKDLLEAVERSNSPKEVLDFLGLPEYNQYGQPNVRWLSCRLTHLRDLNYKIKLFPRGKRPKIVRTEEIAA